MRLRPVSHVDLPTSNGVMRTHLFRPDGDGPFPAVILFAEIYQMTGPIARTAAMLAGHGFVVAVPDVYHEYTEPGESFAYDKEGTERGNRLKTTKALPAYDEDARSVVQYLLKDDGCNGRIGVMGICLGGHLAFRASMNDDVQAGVCLYATDIHQGSLGAGTNDDTLARVSQIQADMMMVWGRQDPHIPLEGRRVIYDAMTTAQTRFSWHEFNAEHAFIRDEGHRYDPSLAAMLMGMVNHHLTSCLK
ncbi:MAG: dienelactone hydrolase family protein [Planctomycetota bacterium]